MSSFEGRRRRKDMRLGMGGGRALFFFPAFEKSNCTICFSKNYFSCFLKLWRGTMDGRRMEETNSGKKEIGDLCIQNE